MPDFAALRLAWEPRMLSILRINRVLEKSPSGGIIVRSHLGSRIIVVGDVSRVCRRQPRHGGARIIVGEIITSAISQTVLTKSVNQFAE